MTPRQGRKAMLLHMQRQGMYHKLSTSKWEPGILRVHHWPSMQGQGVEAAAYMEGRWAKLEAEAQRLGFQLRKNARG